MICPMWESYIDWLPFGACRVSLGQSHSSLLFAQCAMHIDSNEANKHSLVGMQKRANQTGNVRKFKLKVATTTQIVHAERIAK